MRKKRRERDDDGGGSTHRTCLFGAHAPLLPCSFCIARAHMYNADECTRMCVCVCVCSLQPVPDCARSIASWPFFYFFIPLCSLAGLCIHADAHTYERGFFFRLRRAALSLVGAYVCCVLCQWGGDCFLLISKAYLWRRPGFLSVLFAEEVESACVYVRCLPIGA